MTATLGRDTGGHLYKRFSRGVDRAFARFYVKFDVDLAQERFDRSPALRDAAAALLDDPTAEVAVACAAALSPRAEPAVADALVRAAVARADDPWMQAAILSGLNDAARPLLRALLERRPAAAGDPDAGVVRLTARVAAVAGARGRDAELVEGPALLTGPVERAAERSLRLAALAGLAEGLARTPRPLRALLDNPPAAIAPSTEAVRRLLRAAREVARADDRPIEVRRRAIALMVEGDQPDAAGPVLLELLEARRPPQVQIAAARGLARAADAQTARRALERRPEYGLAGRREVQAALVRSPRLTAVLLEALESGALTVQELEPTTRESLRRLPDADARRRAEKLLSRTASVARAGVVGQYQAALELPADAKAGAAVFARHCLVCHQLHGQGHRVGADLAGVIGRSREILLSDILDPGRESSPDFINYVLLTRDGQIVSGIVVGETPAAVTLRRAQGVEETVLRREIQKLRSTGRSLMPDGLEEVISLQDMADLLEFLQRPVPLPAN